VVDFRQRHES